MALSFFSIHSQPMKNREPLLVLPQHRSDSLSPPPSTIDFNAAFSALPFLPLAPLTLKAGIGAARCSMAAAATASNTLPSCIIGAASRGPL